MRTMSLKGLDLEVEEGDFYLCDWWKWSREIHFDEYLGGNLSVDEGDLLLEGKPIKNLSVRKRAKVQPVVFQDPKMGTISFGRLRRIWHCLETRAEERVCWA